MKNFRSSPRLRIITLVLVAVAVGGIGLHTMVSNASASPNTPLVGSGTVEATIVTLSPQLAGRVAEVMAQEGDTVSAGDVLLRLDDMGLQSQRRSALLAAQAAQASAQAELDAAQQALKDLQENAPVVTAQAELNLANARKALDDAMRHRSWQQKGNRASQDTIDGLEAQLALANDKVSELEDQVNHVAYLSADDPKRAQAEAALYEARHARDVIKSNLNWDTGSPTSFDQAILDASVSVAQANVDKAQADFEKVKIGPDPADLAMARAQIDAAQAALAAAKASTQASVDAIDLQLDKLTVRAPALGVVLTRSINPGEVLQPGGTAMTLGRMDTLHVTVYLPENRYGQVSISSQAKVSVDSYPGETFPAVVTHIADQAEYTPRNVQTQEERQTTVYAVELSITDTEGKLIPGMPADVAFE
jgi:HlyD family secretion protein